MTFHCLVVWDWCRSSHVTFALFHMTCCIYSIETNRCNHRQHPGSEDLDLERKFIRLNWRSCFGMFIWNVWTTHRGRFTWENSYRREFHTGMTSWFRNAFTWGLGHFISRLYEDTLHVDKLVIVDTTVDPATRKTTSKGLIRSDKFSLFLFHFLRKVTLKTKTL